MSAIELVTESKTWRAFQMMIGECLPTPDAYIVDTASGGNFPVKGFRVKIGRAQENQLQLLDEEASRQHAEITCYDGRYFIEDLASTNGTLVNGKVVSNRQRLVHGDVIRVGRTLLQFHNMATSSATAMLPINALTPCLG